MLRGFFLLIIAASLAVIGYTLTRERDALSCHGCDVVLIALDAARLDAEYMPKTYALIEKQAAFFPNAYAQSPNLLYSYAALLTGRYSWSLGVHYASDKLPERVATLAESLRAKGYATEAVSAGPIVQSDWGFDQGFASFERLWREETWDDLAALTRALDTWTSAPNNGTPQFLFLRSAAAAAPYESGRLSIRELAMSNANGTADGVHIKAAYLADTRALDEMLSKHIEVLAQRPDTIVAVVAVGGIELDDGSETGLGISLSKESLISPVALFGSSIEPQRIDATVEIRSLSATLLELVGVALPADTVADSLLPFLRGEETADRLVRSRTRGARDEVLAALARYSENYRKDPVELLRSGVPANTERSTSSGAPRYDISLIKGRWQARRTGDAAPVLYDLSKAPGERSAGSKPESVDVSERTRASGLLTEAGRE